MKFDFQKTPANYFSKFTGVIRDNEYYVQLYAEICRN